MELFDSYDVESPQTYMPQDTGQNYNRWSDYDAVNNWGNSMSEPRQQDVYDQPSQNSSFNFDKFMGGGQGLFGAPGSWLSNATSAPSLWQLASSIYSANQAKKQSAEQMALAERMSQRADPFGSQRAAYQSMLANLYSNPTSFTSNPAYRAALSESEEAIRRQAAKSGYLGSGNLLNELSKNAQDQAYKFYDQEAQRLANLSGAQFNGVNTAATTGAMDALNNRYQAKNQAFGQIASQLGGNQYKF